MQTLYNSDSFVVVAFNLPADGPAEVAPDWSVKGGFEIVDKFSRKEIFLEGAVARAFQQGVQALVALAPDGDAQALTDRLNDYIAGYTQLAQQPVLLH